MYCSMHEPRTHTHTTEGFVSQMRMANGPGNDTAIIHKEKKV